MNMSSTQVIQINEYHQIFTSALQACQNTNGFWLPDGEINGIFTAFMRWQSDELNSNFEHMNSMFDDTTQEEIRQGYKPFWVDAKSTFVGGDTSSGVEKFSFPDPGCGTIRANKPSRVHGAITTS